MSNSDLTNTIFHDPAEYAGIGSRETPIPVLTLMLAIAQRLASLSWILRSGGARGADQAFQLGARQHCKVYLPDHPTAYFAPANAEIYNQPTPDAFHHAANHHPNWSACSKYARSLHARNSHILLDMTLDKPVSFVICWTPNGKTTGGTGQGIPIAQSENIPVHNLHNPETRHWFKTFAFDYLPQEATK